MIPGLPRLKKIKPPSLKKVPGPRFPRPSFLESQKSVDEQQPWRNPPASWPGSGAEWAAMWGLKRLGYQEGVEFTYQQAAIGGRLPGGAVLDFFFPDLSLGLRVQGIYFHYDKSGGNSQAADQAQRVALESSGVRVVDMDEDQLLNNPIPVIKNAINGIDTSRAARGLVN